MPRPIWKGHISFGLVNVAVTLYSAEQKSDLRFQLIDSRNTARVRYERVNEETGEEVPWDKIVKGYAYDDGNYVLLSKEELENASAELTKTIDIEQFVDLNAIDPVFFDKPYYLVPNKGGEKGYVLLREAMQKAGRIGIANVVIRSRGHLAAMMPEGNALVLTILRYAQEVRDLSDFDVPEGKLSDYKISKKELELAGQLLEGMSSDWEPENYHDEYRDALMKLIDKRIQSGETEVVSSEQEDESEAPQTLNFMDVLKQSVKKTSQGGKSGASGKGKGSSEKGSKKKAS